MNYIIAITGGICSGKSTVSAIFSKLNIQVVDSDKIAKSITQPNSETIFKIAKYFGYEILKNDGSLNKYLLRQYIFYPKNKKHKTWLNNLLHPLIRIKTKQILDTYKNPYIIWMVPLLIENNLQNIANRILVIDSTISNQIRRIIKRDKINEHQAKNIIRSQINRNNRLQFADDIINNNGKYDDIIYEVRKLHNLYHDLSNKWIYNLKNKYQLKYK